MPTSAAVVRVLRRRVPGARLPALPITRSTTSGAIAALRPRPERSTNPSKPCCSKRCDHLLTEAVDVPTSRATSACFMPRDRNSTMRARRQSRVDVVPPRMRRLSSAASSAVSSRTETGRPMNSRLLLSRPREHGTEQPFIKLIYDTVH